VTAAGAPADVLVKATGAVLLIGATTAAGFSIASRYSRRTGALRELRSALEVLRTEIAYGARPLPDALARAASFVRQPASSTLSAVARELSSGTARGAAAAWSRALSEGELVSCLKREDVEVLEDVGARLGTSDGEGEMRNLGLALERLRAHEARAREEDLVVLLF